MILIFGFCTMWDYSVWTGNFAKMDIIRATIFIISQQHVLWKVFSILVTHPVVIGMDWAPTGVQWVACLCNLQQWPQYLLLELPNIVHSFRWQSAVAASLTSDKPCNIIPVSKTLTFCEYNLSLSLCMFLEQIEDVWWCKCSVLPLTSLLLHIVQISRK